MGERTGQHRTVARDRLSRRSGFCAARFNDREGGTDSQPDLEALADAGALLFGSIADLKAGQNRTVDVVLVRGGKAEVDESATACVGRNIAAVALGSLVDDLGQAVAS